MKELTLEPEMGPLDFQMQPGGNVRVRVLDEHGKPVPKARIFFQGWRGRFHYFEFDHVSQYADAQGVWVWNEAPLDEFEADISRPDGMQLAKQAIIARDEEYVFRPPPALVISGKVSDAQTGQPVKRLQVVPGIRYSETHMNWARDGQFIATEGKYRIRHRHDYFAHLVRIEAEGYQPAVSRDIKSNEGDVTIDFELTRGSDVASTVLVPDGRPAAGAQVALGIAGSHIGVTNGVIDQGSTNSARQNTNKSGEFRFPPQDTAFQLMITHPAGYAHVSATAQSMPATIRLEAWARVEGTFRLGNKLTTNVPITINTAGLHSYGADGPSIFSQHDATTGKGGRFVFERVIPGRGRIGRRLMLTVSDGAADVVSSCTMVADFPPGETTRFDLGGAGRPVVGKMQPREGFEDQVKWNFAVVNVVVDLPAPPQAKSPAIPAEITADPVKRADWLLKWQQTPEGQGWLAWKVAQDAYQRLRETSPRFTATVDRDGSFRIDDMTAGDYLLSVHFSRDAAGQLRDYRFTVPAMDEDRSDQELDLGDLTLE
jgi:hypothetical protein